MTTVFRTTPYSASVGLTRLVGRSFSGAVLPLLVASAFAQTTPTFNVPASATVVTPLTIGSASTLNFGAFAPNAKLEGKVTIPPTGARTGDNVTLMATNVGGASTITVAGDPAMKVKLELPTSDVILTAGPGLVMTINAVDFKTNLTPDTQLLPSGTLSFQMGATLTVSKGQATGNYSGVVPITVTYQ